MYFANFALSLLKTCSRLKVVEEEIQEPEDVRDLPVFIFLSLSCWWVIPHPFHYSFITFRFPTFFLTALHEGDAL